MSFVVQQMLGDKALVSGTDHRGAEGKTIVSTTQWDELKARQNFSAAAEDFDAAVEAFFKPLTKAAKKVQKQLAQSREQDPAEYVVLREGTEGVQAEAPQIVGLTHDSIVLRLIEEGQTDRLVWVDESTLGILAR